MPDVAADAPVYFSSRSGDWRRCVPKKCSALAGIECVPGGAKPCERDKDGNIGYSNDGMNNFGEWQAMCTLT